MLAELLDALAHIRPAAVRGELQGSTDTPKQACIAPLFVVLLRFPTAWATRAVQDHVRPLYLSQAGEMAQAS